MLLFSCQLLNNLCAAFCVFQKYSLLYLFRIIIQMIQLQMMHRDWRKSVVYDENSVDRCMSLDEQHFRWEMALNQWLQLHSISSSLRI